MKKIFVFLSLIVLATSCDWFVFDNQEYYNASVEGKLLDTKTGQPLQFAFPNTCKISIIEEGWTDKAGNPAEEAQSWYVKCNGVYVNKLVWAAKYRMETKDQNFYPVSIPFELKKGDNTVNFEVTPYCRVLDPQITFEDNKIVARFKVEVEDIPEGGPAEEDQECRRHLRHRAQDRPVQREGERHAVRLQAHPLSPDRRPRLRRREYQQALQLLPGLQGVQRLLQGRGSHQLGRGLAVIPVSCDKGRSFDMNPES